MLSTADLAIGLLTSAFGGSAAFFLGREAYSRLKRAWRRRTLRNEGPRDPASVAVLSGGGSVNALHAWVLEEMVKETRRAEASPGRTLMPARWGESAWLEARLDFAGLRGVVSSAAFWTVRVKTALLGAASGLVVGMCLSMQLSALLGVVGAIVGWLIPKSVVSSRIKGRADQMERHLAEMLDVMALGLRSGLSFERSLDLYLSHFDSMLAQAFGLAKKQWLSGLMTREEALRKVATSYDSPVMARVIEDMVRSLRFGSSLAESLEMSASEVRSSYRSKKEEQVAKAPVKMMVPTGALILPAMLIMVLGPVLLELMEGF